MSDKKVDLGFKKGSGRFSQEASVFRMRLGREPRQISLLKSESQEHSGRDQFNRHECTSENRKEADSSDCGHQ
jgi:hypothetical protein